MVLEGLDTLCSIYLNGTHVSDTDNMHLRYEFEVTGLLREQNFLQVVCHSPTKYIAKKDAESHLFVPPKHYEWGDPELTCRREGDELVATAAAIAKGVFVEGIDGDVILSDNSFDMEPGERHLQILSGNATEFAVTSLYSLF